MLSIRKPFKYKDLDILDISKVQGKRKIAHANNNQNKAGVAILILNKSEVVTKKW